MKKLIATALAIGLATTPAYAGGKWQRKMAIAAIGLTLLGVGGPAFAGGNGGRYYEDDGPPYGYGPANGNGPYGYGPINGRGYVNGNGYRPPPPRPPTVPVEPAFCDREDTIFVPRFNRWMCRPVMVPRANGNGY